MIPFQEMTFGDFDFYWGDSILFHRKEGEWLAVQPSNHDGDGEGLMHCESTTLEEIAADGYNLVFYPTHGSPTNSRIECGALDPFESDDWITYEPPLGYFLIEGKLVLVTSNVPRNRNKGLHGNRLRTREALDASAMPDSIARLMMLPEGYSLPVHTLAREIANRLNNPFPDSWYSTIVSALGTDTPCILDASTCVIPDSTKELGHIMLQGSLLGSVALVDTRLEFTPRARATTMLEKSVNAYLQAKLLTTNEVTSDE